MAKLNGLSPHLPEFDRFLHASVGEDRNGYSVTVLSTLARLDLDPWSETAELVSLGNDGARERLGKLLARFEDVPSLAGDHHDVARDLSNLLPEGRVSGAQRRAAPTVSNGRPGMTGAIWAALAIIFVLYQMFMIGRSGSGE